jgi:hypothetical protein
MWRCSRYGKEGFVGEIDLHPRLSWTRWHPCILKNMDPLKVSCCLFIREKLGGGKGERVERQLSLTMVKSKVGCFVLGKVEYTEGICSAQLCIHLRL